MFLLLRLPTFLDPPREFEERAEQGGAVIIDQLDQPGLLHQAAQLDQVPCPRAPVLDRLALVIACPIPVQSITQHAQAL